MTTYNDMTKAELNALLPENLRCKNASQLKKTSKADLIDMLEPSALAPKHDAQIAMLATDLTPMEKHVVVAFVDACTECNGAETLEDVLADNMTWLDVKELAQRTGLKQQSVKGVLGSLAKRGIVGTADKPNGEPGVDQYLTDTGVRVAFELMADGIKATAPKAAPKAEKQPRKLEARTYCEPCSDIADLKPIRAGTKRAILAEALVKGATLEQLCEATGWNRATVQSAFRVDLKPMGYGVHRDAKGVYWLDLPKKAKRPAIREAGKTVEEVMVAACR